MIFSRSKLPLVLLIAVSAFALLGFGCRKPQPVQQTTTTSLLVWGLWQDSDVLGPVLRAFKDQTGIDFKIISVKVLLT
ncbi:MAG: hypothetical protein AAB649_07010 [Patescibacteria group bacterium]